MALLASSIAQVCKSLVQYLASEFDGLDTKVHVLLGSPADAATSEQDSEHNLNLFFFRFEPSGFDADTQPGQTHYLRMHCLATPFAVAEESISSGENDLRIIGEVWRVFQEKPVFEVEADGERFHLQVLFQTLEIDQINQLWSTQGDTVYRPSILLEVSLAPVVPREPHIEAPLAGGLGLGVTGQMERSPSTRTLSPGAVRRRPDTRQDDWSPASAFVYQGNLAESLNFALGSTALDGFTPQVWVVGAPGVEVVLRWEVWSSEAGWQPHPDTMTVTLQEEALSPETLGEATLHTPALPAKDQAAQWVLYAERHYHRESDGHPMTQRSNPLLINLYEEAP